MNAFLLGSYTLAHRELVRFFRQRSRVIGALVPPIVFWFLIGSGLGASFRLPTGLAGVPGIPATLEGSRVTYLQYFFPGTIALIVLFTAIFSTISIIEDRHEGFLQSVLVAPLSRGSIVLGKIAGGTLLAFIQGLAFLLLASLTGISLAWRAWPVVLLMLLMISFGLTGLGFFLAWQLDSSQGFHAIMNLLLIPMWLLSGTLFPVSGAPFWLRVVMHINPLTYGVAVLQQQMTVGGVPLVAGVLPLGACFGAILLFDVLTFAASYWTAQRG